jgi:hypothetical protein
MVRRVFGTGSGIARCGNLPMSNADKSGAVLACNRCSLVGRTVVHDDDLRRVGELFPGRVSVPPVSAQGWTPRSRPGSPVIVPPFSVESSHDEDPVNGIMRIGRGRERPGHIRVNHG